MQTPARPPAAQSFRRTALPLVLALLVVAGLYGEEILHYKHTLYGFKEHYVTRNLNNHPECSERGGNPRELVCPMPGYNSIRLSCLTDQCAVEDQDAIPVTDAAVATNRARLLAEFGRMPRRGKTWDQTPREDTPAEMRQQQLEDDRQAQQAQQSTSSGQPR